MEYNVSYDSKEQKLHFKNPILNKYNEMESVNLKADGGTSDGYHTFDELYYHRMVLFAVICNQNSWDAWKSKLHHDGTMYDDMFIVGIHTKEGDYTYHYDMEHWDKFNVQEYVKAPEWDGHKPEDITRLFSLLK